MLATILADTLGDVPWTVDPASRNGLRLLRPQTPLFHEGDRTDNFYEILSGVVRAFKVFADGRRQIVSFAFPNDIVGFGHGDTYRFECEAISDAIVRVIPKASLMRSIRERPELGEKLLQIAAGEVANMQDLSILLFRKTAVERIATFLMSMARRRPDVGAGARQPLPMCRADIGDFLGLTISTVSRTLTKLRDMNVIEVPDRGGFVVLDFHKLLLLSESEDTVH